MKARTDSGLSWNPILERVSKIVQQCLAVFEGSRGSKKEEGLIKFFSLFQDKIQITFINFAEIDDITAVKCVVVLDTKGEIAVHCEFESIVFVFSERSNLF